ncbi:MAG: hypothetical protein WCF95_05735 [bacterium]
MKVYLKPVVILSAIVGAILGLLLLMPFFSFNFLVCMLFSMVSVFVILYLKKNGLVGILEPVDGALIGALSGFVCVIAANIVYIPLYGIISAIFKTFGQGIGISIFAKIMIQNFNLFITGMFLFFFGVIGAIFNAFSGLICAYVYEKFEMDGPEETTHFEIEQD